MSRFFVFLGWITALSCGGAQRSDVLVPSIAATVEPLNELYGVVLGGSLESVQRARKGAFPAPYVGLVEPFGSDSIFYRFAGRPETVEGYGAGLRTTFPANAPLTAVDSWRRFAADSLGRAYWNSIITKIARQHGSPSECFEIRNRIVQSLGVVWRVSGVEIAALLTPRWVSPSSVSGDQVYLPRVRVIVGPGLRKDFPEMSTAVATPCEAISGRTSGAV